MNWGAVAAVAAVITAAAEVQQSWASRTPPPSFQISEAKVVSDLPLSRHELSELNKTELRLLRNAVFARHGEIFEPSLQTYFSKRAWYPRRVVFNSASMTNIDWHNVEVIKAVESRCKE